MPPAVIQRLHTTPQEIRNALGQKKPLITIYLENGRAILFREVIAACPKPHRRGDVWLLGGYGRVQNGPNKTRNEYVYFIKVSTAPSSGIATIRRGTERELAQLIELLDPTSLASRQRKDPVWVSVAKAEKDESTLGITRHRLSNAVARLISKAESAIGPDGKFADFTEYRVRQWKGRQPEIELRSVMESAERTGYAGTGRVAEGTFMTIKRYLAWQDEATAFAGSFK